MPDITEDALRAVRDRASLFDFLGRSLGWETSSDDTFTYLTPPQPGLPEDRVEVSRLVPFGGVPFVLMLAEFQTPFRRTDLRKILQGIRRDDRLTQRYGGISPEEIIFVCPVPDESGVQDYGGVSFAHFEEREGRAPRLQVVGWDRAHLHETRTLRTVNLRALEMPGRNPLDGYDWTTGRAKWLKAWDVQAVTRDFFRDYKLVYSDVQTQIGAVRGDKNLWTQRLFHRLLFIQFLSRRGWMRYGGRKDYLKALWDSYGSLPSDQNFYRDRLVPLFFLGLNNDSERDLGRINGGGVLGDIIGEVPFLNGGLFDPAEGETKREEVPDAAIAAVLDLFARYNFTIMESTPDDVEVAVDPEMLGEVFERLVTQSDRKLKGSYYTPRAIVQFMCREALKGYLGGYEELVDGRRAQAIPQEEARELLRKLAAVRVLDPACGSGAYLLGMLHELFDLIGLLEVRADPLSPEDTYKRKLDIIERNIYGVDLQEFAVETARLRLWLSLVVEDERRPLDEPVDVALPNLDFKIERGDSLSAPSPQQTEDLIRHGYVQTFQRLKGRHLRAHGPQKQALYDEAMLVRAEIADGSHSGRQIEGFDWDVEFAEVLESQGGRPGGFDIILANPPYGATVADGVRDTYFSPRLAAERGQSKDTYGLFIARALQLLRPGGQFCYIVSDTWRTIKSHKPLRRRLAETTTVKHVLDLPAWVFEDPTVNTCILTFTASPPPADHTLIAGDLRNIKSGDWTTLEENLRSAAAHGVDVQTTRYARYTYKQSLIGTSDSYTFFVGSSKIFELLNHSRFHKLSRIADVKHGLTTGDTKSYVYKDLGGHGTYNIAIDSLKVDPLEASRVLSLSEKKDGFEPAKLSGRYLVPYDKGGPSDSNEGWLPNYSVPTQYYIDWRKDSVSDMKKLPGFRHDGKEYYFKKGISFSHTGAYSPTFRLGSGGVFDTAGSCLFPKTEELELVLGLLCSTLTRYQFKAFINHTVNAAEDPIKEIKIPINNTEVAQELIAKVKNIVSKQAVSPRYPYQLHEQKEIDALIYDLYGLDADDIREVELWFCRRYPLLAQAQGVLPEVLDKYAEHLAHAARLMAQPPGYWRSHPLLALIAQGESATLEFKETLEYDVRQGGASAGVLGSALKTLCAFANTDGGTLLIGVADSGAIKGLTPDYSLFSRGSGNRDTFEQKLRSLLQGRFQPAFAPPTHDRVAIEFEDLPDGTVCRITVQPLPRTETIHFDNAVYVRDGNGSRKLEGPVLTRWMQERMRG